MATLTETIQIVFGATGVGNISSAVDTVNQSLDSIADKARQMANISLGFAAGVTAIGAGLAANAFDAAKDFEEAMAEVAKALAEHEEVLLPEISQRIIDLSETYGVAATNVASSTANFKQAGFDVEGALKLTESNLKLVKTGAVSAEEGTSILIRILKGYKAPVEDSERILDILNGVTAKYATNIPDLAEALARTAGTARSIGLSLEETSSILVPILEVFQNSEQAATAFNSTMINLTSSSAAEGLRLIGVAQKETINGVEQLRSSKDILGDVVRKFGSLTGDQQLYVSNLLAGKEHAVKMVEVFSGMTKSEGVLATAISSTGRTAEELAISLATAQSAIDQFKTGWTNVMISIGREFLTEVKGIINGASDIENAFRKVIDGGGLEPLFNLLRPQLDTLAEIFRSVARNLPEAFKGIDYSGLIKGLSELGESVKRALGGIFGDIDVTSVEGLHRALQTFFDALGGFARVISGQVEFWQPLWNAIGLGATEMGKVDEASLKTVGKLLEAGRSFSEFGGLITGAITFLGTNADDVKTTFDTVVRGIGLAIDTLKTGFNGMVLLWKKGAWEIADVLSKLPDSLGGDSWKYIADDLKTEIGVLKNNFDTSFDDMSKSANSFWDATTGLGVSSDPAKTVLDDIDKKQTDIFEKRKAELAALAGDAQATRARDNSEAKLAEVKREVIASGKAFEITLNAANLAVPLGNILDEIVSAFQVRATEEGAEMLVGCG